jgi:hypothetical protein
MKDKTRFLYYIILILLVGIGPATSKPAGDIESYGVYVDTGKSYVRFAPFKHDSRLVNFKYLNEVPEVKRKGEKVKLIVHLKKFSPEAMEIKVRTLDVKVHLQKITFKTRTMKKKNMYELTLDSPVKDGAMLQIYYGSFFDNMGVVMLGDTREELVRYFSRKKMNNASIVIQYLNDALVAYPRNSKLKSLANYWEKAAKNEKDKKTYSYVEEKWQKYEKAEKLTLKQRYLNKALGEINGYLNHYPDGLKAKEARKRKALAEKKLKEYEKLL